MLTQQPPVVMIVSDRHSKAKAGSMFSQFGKPEDEQMLENHELDQVRRNLEFGSDWRETAIKKDGKLLKLEVRRTVLSDDMLAGTTPWPEMKADYFLIVMNCIGMPKRMASHQANMEVLLPQFNAQYPNQHFMLVSATSDKYQADPVNKASLRMISEATGIALAKRHGADAHRDVNPHSWVAGDANCQLRTLHYDLHRLAYESRDAKLVAARRVAPRAESKKENRADKPKKKLRFNFLGRKHKKAQQPQETGSQYRPEGIKSH